MSTAAIVRRCNGSKALILGERCDGRHKPPRQPYWS